MGGVGGVSGGVWEVCGRFVWEVWGRCGGGVTINITILPPRVKLVTILLPRVINYNSTS